MVGSDDVTLDGGTAAFDTKDVGADKTVTVTGATLAGTDAGNYTLGSVNTATADIDAKRSPAASPPPTRSTTAPPTPRSPAAR